MTDEKTRNKLARLDELRAEFISVLPSRLDSLVACWRKAETTDRWGESYAELLGLAHSLAGTAGIFDFRLLGAKAREMEVALFSLSQQATPLAPVQKKELADLLDSLLQLAKAGPDTGRDMSTGGVHASLAPVAHSNNRRVILVEDDKLLAQTIQTQLSMFDWDVHVVNSAEGARPALQGPVPAAVIVDVSLPEGPLAGIELIHQVQATGGVKIPHIVISSRVDWESRLAAVRSGAHAYMVKPLDIPGLANQLDRVVFRNSQTPFRVLMLDDDEALLRHYALILGSAGMNVVTLSDPSQLLQHMAQHRPEIVLLDLHLPNCNGVEVMQVIRQNQQFDSVPVVFLSTEAGFSRQLNAMHSGAEDFLRKDLSDLHLINAVRVRAERFRLLTSLIREDSLTGLLNHVAFKMRLENEVERCHRSGETISLAMLDIDLFKRVNDTHGHPQGDKVIKTLAQLLRARLRISDIIGRYGGEEFVIAMPNTQPAQAKKTLDELRESFGNLQFESPQGLFKVTLSSGIAGYPDCLNAAALIIEADEALYQAKISGRNRVEVSRQANVKS